MAFTPINSCMSSGTNSLTLQEPQPKHAAEGAVVRAVIAGSSLSMNRKGVESLIQQLSGVLGEKPPVVRSGQRSAFG